MEVIGSSPSDPALTDSLPEDPIGQILLRLPIQCLMRSKYVSKRWCKMITCVYRLASGRQRRLHDPTTPKLSIILVVHGNYDNDYEHIKMCLLRRDESKIAESDITNIMKHTVTGIIGSSNGLVCVNHSFGGSSMMLWNPVTKKCRNLPEAPSTPCIGHVALGFGFDEHGKDYKVVRIVEVFEKSTNDVRRVDRSVYLQVFTTSSDSWRIQRISITSLEVIRQVGIFLNGALYWSTSKFILSFDLHNEELRMSHVPKSPGHYCQLIKWKESLALLSFRDDSVKLQELCEVLVMRKRNNRFERRVWTPVFRQCAPFYFPGVSGNQFLVSKSCGEFDDEQTLLFPSSCENECWNVKKVLEPGWKFLNEAHDYVPSLVSVYPNHEDEDLEENGRRDVE